MFKIKIDEKTSHPTQLNVRINPDVYSRLKLLCKHNRVTIQELTSQMVIHCISELEKNAK